MINLIIDTNIYRKNPKLDNNEFKALEKLANAKVLKLQIPYVIQREFQTQQRELCKSELDKSLSGVSNLLRRPLSKDSLEEIFKIKKSIDENYNDILDASESYFTDWVKKINGSILPLCEEQALSAMEAYFCGALPLTKVKDRNDIPDSFIVQAINKLSKGHSNLVVIAEDEKVRKAFDEAVDIKSYSQLSDFIKSTEIQDKLKDIDLIADLPTILDAIVKFEENSGELASEISSKVGDYICGETIENSSIPDDNNEAHISQFGDVDSITLDLNGVAYYGSGNVSIPFEVEMYVYACYYIFKADYYGLDNPPSVSDHNDHYFEAEEEFRVKVNGIASVMFDRDKLDFDDFSNTIKPETLEIDTIESIELC
ncbi:PIN domain-containing protein [Aeromonas salmonicida]|nr:DUF4935 domain-containing protein [Aeromonas salmonicida]